MTVDHTPQPKCRISKTYQGYVARIVFPEPSTSSLTNAPRKDATKPTLLPSPILIIDTSLSMSHHAARLIRQILSTTLTRLGYPSTTDVHILTFETTTHHSLLLLFSLPTFPHFGQGSTYMAHAVGGARGVGMGVLVVEGARVRRWPWEAVGDAECMVKPEGEEVVWLDAVPTRMTVGGVEVAVEVADSVMDRAGYEMALGRQIEAFLQRARVLKVVDTEASQQQLQKMLAYFDELDRAWFASEEKMAAEKESERGEQQVKEPLTPLATRSQRLRRLLTKTIGNRLASVVNDTRVGAMNAAQQADYLRTVSVTKTTKGLAKRGATSSSSSSTSTTAFDFDTIARAEVRAMHAHIASLSSIDDSHHAVSFYSRATTLDGIRTVASLADAPECLDTATTPQILELFNIVGVPCAAPVGDYPDPMTYRIHEIFPVCMVSLADVLTYNLESGGEDLPDTRDEQKNR
ncbi:uncharacterized protein EV422DRAFT_623275 [Fimicolochytrium jonesii]|uniref:uncharacterized protein n=1 Tax=Fimicolochytrium jonesii TaxID=1396493 RepID=UPI0022FEA071|nr:uncharacterized protein EV422DRAFT_623275 [Fimicolochytrium jonesii]KAI8816598.1 hypothetical protein EV422DRAFT_623275 [Fimicolochytrium jonesii]